MRSGNPPTLEVRERGRLGDPNDFSFLLIETENVMIIILFMAVGQKILWLCY